MNVEPLSIDIRGQWSPRQAKAIREALAPELEERWLTLEEIDIRTHASPARVLLSLRCAKHDCPVDDQGRCDACARNL